MSRLPKLFEPDPNPQIAYFSPKKGKKGPLDYIKLKARFEGDIENLCCSAIGVDLEHILNQNPNPKKAQFLL